MDFKPRSIIIRMPNWIGDFVMATPILTDVRQAFPEAEITAMCQTPLGELLLKDKSIDEVFSFTRASSFTRRIQRRDIIEKLRQGNYDLGILLTNSFSSAWWFWQGGVKRRLGYVGHWRRFLLSDPVFREGASDEHLVVTYKKLLRPLGIEISETKPRLFLGEEELQQARSLLKKLNLNTPLIGMNPGAAYGSAKCWLPERFREVTEKLLERKDLSILYFGDQKTSPLVKEICQGLPARVVNLAGVTSLRELSCLIKLCSVFLTNDSGPMHIAAAVGTPIVALFGSTNPTKTGPYKTGRVIHKQVSCSPCYQRVCPIDFRCMKQIASQEVIEEILTLLDQKK